MSKKCPLCFGPPGKMSWGGVGSRSCGSKMSRQPSGGVASAKKMSHVFLLCVHVPSRAPLHRSAGWLTAWLARWVAAGWLVDWLAGWLAGWLVGWLAAGWPDSWLAGWLAG